MFLPSLFYNRQKTIEENWSTKAEILFFFFFSFLLLFQGCFQVCYAFHCGGNRCRHVNGRAAENDACCARVQNISVFLWGEFPARFCTQLCVLALLPLFLLQLHSHFCIQTICIWGAGGATPGKFLIGLRVVTCDSSVLVQPNRVLVVPATNVSLSAWVYFLFSGFTLFSPPLVCRKHCHRFPLQINCPSLEQELFHRLLFPGLHHTSVLPAQ